VDDHRIEGVKMPHALGNVDCYPNDLILPKLHFILVQEVRKASFHELRDDTQIRWLHDRADVPFR
jgi:hypothetical protein